MFVRIFSQCFNVSWIFLWDILLGFFDVAGARRDNCRASNRGRRVRFRPFVKFKARKLLSIILTEIDSQLWLEVIIVIVFSIF